MPLLEQNSRRAWVWGVLLAVMGAPVVVAAFSPLLAYRDAPYIVAGFGGAIALALLVVQPLLGLRALPGLRPAAAHLWHRVTGMAILVAVLVHVGGLYLTSPPDTIDALLLVSPTAFSVYGVAALVALVLAALLSGLRRRIGLARWRRLHGVLALVVVTGSIVHALLIEGTMGPASKLALCLTVGGIAAYGILYTRLIRPLLRG